LFVTLETGRLKKNMYMCIYIRIYWFLITCTNLRNDAISYRAIVFLSQRRSATRDTLFRDGLRM